MAPPTKVTVLIDTFNHERFIDQAVRSVLEQDFDMSQVEIIVIDDGSTDSTPERLASYGSRIRLVRKPNGGQASAFNTGIPLAQGEITAMLDGDDWWHPGKLRAVADALDRHPRAVAVGHGIFMAYEGGGPPEPHRPPRDTVFSLQSMEGAGLFPAISCFLGTSRLAARTQALKKLLPVPDPLIVEADEYFFTLLPAMGDVVVLRDAWCYYRIHGGNLFQFSAQCDRRSRLKMQVMNCLAEILPSKILALGVPEANMKRALRATQLDARRLKLAVEGGPPGSALCIELAAWRDDANWSFRRMPAKIAMLVLALLLPGRLYYKVRSAYGRALGTGMRAVA